MPAKALTAVLLAVSNYTITVSATHSLSVFCRSFYGRFAGYDAGLLIPGLPGRSVTLYSCALLRDFSASVGNGIFAQRNVVIAKAP